MTVSYITYAKLAQDCQLLIKSLPRSVVLDLVGVLGIPRSGLLPATMIANHFHLPVIDSYSFVRFSYQFSLSGRRVHGQSQGRTVLVVDDSIYAGTSMNQALDVLLENSPGDIRYVSAAIYRCPEKKAEVDYHARDVAKPRYFQWNLMQHPDMGRFMLDMDGVICYDPPRREEDYEDFAPVLGGALPLHLPAYAAHSICTMRLDKYRSLTQDWLSKHNVRYGQLIMSEAATVQERRKNVDYGHWKGQRYKESDAQLFIESEPNQAIGIAYHSRKPVICLGNHEIYQPVAGRPQLDAVSNRETLAKTLFIADESL